MRYYATKKKLMSKENKKNKRVTSLPVPKIVALSTSIKSTSDIDSMYTSTEQATNLSPFECEYEHESHHPSTNGNTGNIQKNHTKGKIDFDNEYEN